MLIEDIGNLLSDDDFRRVKTEILVQMQGVGQENEGLHVILTTNEPQQRFNYISWREQILYIRYLEI
jgi:SpoVK/Ycf46/Vps4 family AAA+-type ATPase